MYILTVNIYKQNIPEYHFLILIFLINSNKCFLPSTKIAAVEVVSMTLMVYSASSSKVVSLTTSMWTVSCSVRIWIWLLGVMVLPSHSHSALRFGLETTHSSVAVCPSKTSMSARGLMNCNASSVKRNFKVQIFIPVSLILNKNWFILIIFWIWGKYHLGTWTNKGIYLNKTKLEFLVYVENEIQNELWPLTVSLALVSLSSNTQKYMAPSSKVASLILRLCSWSLTEMCTRSDGFTSLPFLIHLALTFDLETSQVMVTDSFSQMVESVRGLVILSGNSANKI